MKVRIRFSKTGALVYIGHLDVMRYFQKLFRRAHIPVAYSEGFSPHQILSFSNPLPLGMESTGEYADAGLTGSVSSGEALKRLREQSVPEIEIMSFKALADDAENAMASVCAAGYQVSLPHDMMDKAENAIGSFLASRDVSIVKRSKKSERIVNIRPLVYELYADKEKEAIRMLISSGSTDNLKPELVLDTLFGAEDDEKRGASYDITRLDQYTMVNQKLVSLDDIGTVIL